MRRNGFLTALGIGIVGLLVPGMLVAPKPSVAMPTFAQAYGLSCSACHVQVPLLNAYGRYLQRTGYASLDRKLLGRALPIWLGESANYNSTAGSGTGTPRYSFGNLALHGVGYIAPDVTFHAQQFVTSSDQSGGVDTLWVTFNGLLNREGHLFVGKILNPAPAPYSQDFELDGPSASGTGVGEHNWAGTYGNRWGTRFAFVHKALDLEAGYYLTAEDLNGITDFSPGDKTFQWKAAYARPDFPVEGGLFGSVGTIPVSTGTDVYHSVAAYLQVDPGLHGRPGLLGVYQQGRDSNPGVDGASGNIMPATSSRGASLSLYEPILRGNAALALRHDFNDNGFGTVGNGNAINLGFNVPHFSYAHGYLEANFGGNSALAGASGGPTWKGMLWLTLPIKNVTAPNSTVAAASPSEAGSPSPSAPAANSPVPAPATLAESPVPGARASPRTATAPAPAPVGVAPKAVAASVGNTARGKALYGTNCAGCHGATGAEGGVGPSLRGEKGKKDLAGVTRWIENPQPPMPKLYPSPLSAKDVRDIAAFIETM